MNKNISIFEFGCNFFGHEKSLKMNKKYIKSYYEDWKRTPYSIEKYKRLLQTRG